ncbi:MAG: AAA family ATPase [bacterium]
MKISNQKIREIESKRKELSNISNELKKMFFGIDSVIDQMLHSIEPWYLFPEACFKPYIVNLWGMTGCGKTDVVRKLVELLNYKRRFLYFDMGQYSQQGSGKSFNRIWDEELSYLNNKPCIICLDEFQHLRTINEDFRETERSDIRNVWELIDTGKMEYNDYQGWSLTQELNQLVYYLSSSLKRNVQVQNGVVVNGEEEFIKLLQDGSEKYRFRFDYNYKNKTDEDADTKKFFIPQYYYEEFYNLLVSEFENIFDFEKQILSMNGNQSIEFLKNIIRRINQPKMLDLRKALIFIVGNIDEAFSMSHDLNPDNDPDIMHKFSLEITTTEIKKELMKRFRLEQIARLGNNHLIYPAFNVETYKKIIDYRLDIFKSRIKKDFELEIDFGQSVKDIIYKEGVFPTQGARPVLTTLNLLIDSYFSKIMGDIIKFKSEVVKLNWEYTDKKFNLELYNKEDEKLDSFSYDVVLQVENLRQSKCNDKQAVIAVHESGHAIVSCLRSRILPKEIFSVSADNETGGRCVHDMPRDIITKKLLLLSIEVSLGGYLADRIVFGDENTTPGTEQDLLKATSYATDIIKKYGMGKSRHRIGVPYMGDTEVIPQDNSHQREIENILNMCEQRAEEVLLNNKKLLLEMANYLSQNTKMDQQKIRDYVMKYSSEEWARKGEFKTKENFFGLREMLEEEVGE